MNSSDIFAVDGYSFRLFSINPHPENLKESDYPKKNWKFTGSYEILSLGGFNAAQRNRKTVAVPIYECDGQRMIDMTYQLTPLSKPLFLVLKAEWFSKIQSGEKTEEYREITPYWEKRLSKGFESVIFQLGYNKDSPRCEKIILDITKGYPNPKWSPKDFWDKELFIIKLGEEKV